MNPGDTFKIAGRIHLWIVISDPSQDRDSVVTVNMTDATTCPDQTCVIHPGEHTYVRKETCIFYGMAKIVSDQSLELQLSQGRLKLHDPVDSTLLQRIRDGCIMSKQTPQIVKDILKNQRLVSP